MIKISHTDRLVADIGGTNARFALANIQNELHSIRILRCAEHETFEDAIRHFLAEMDNPKIQDAIIAIATPVLGDQIKMTNHHWAFSTEEVRRKFGFNNFLVVNDFAALAMSLPFLRENDVRRIDRDGLIRGGVKAVIGPGTGLGIAGLIPLSYGWQPLPTEGGHVDFAPCNELEIEILRLLLKEQSHVSPEDLISGPGIELLYATLLKLAGLPMEKATAAEIAGMAKSGNSVTAKQTLSLFSGLLGSVAGNVALMMNSVGGLYIGGGIIAKLGDAFDTFAFRTRFTAKGRYSTFLEAIPNYLIVSDNPAFIGATEILSQQLALQKNS